MSHPPIMLEVDFDTRTMLGMLRNRLVLKRGDAGIDVEKTATAGFGMLAGLIWSENTGRNIFAVAPSGNAVAYEQLRLQDVFSDQSMRYSDVGRTTSIFTFNNPDLSRDLRVVESFLASRKLRAPTGAPANTFAVGVRLYADLALAMDDPKQRLALATRGPADETPKPWKHFAL